MLSRSRFSLKLNQPKTTTHMIDAISINDKITEAQVLQQLHRRLRGISNKR